MPQRNASTLQPAAATGPPANTICIYAKTKGENEKRAVGQTISWQGAVTPWILVVNAMLPDNRGEFRPRNSLNRFHGKRSTQHKHSYSEYLPSSAEKSVSVKKIGFFFFFFFGIRGKFLTCFRRTRWSVLPEIKMCHSL